jgi:ParB family chromosome partitioning protein
VAQINVDVIRPNRAQPRIEFDNNSIIRLADSIRRYGILQPLVVREYDEEGHKFELVAGERRLRAAKLLGYYTVPCIIVEADEKMSAEMAIIENLLREDLNMFEEAYAFRELIDNFSLTQEEVARKVSMSQSAVANKLRLLKLTFDEQKIIIELGLTERHARALLKIGDASLRIDAIKHISSENLNVLAAERYIERLLSKENDESNSSSKPVSFDFERLTSDAIGVINKKIEGLKRLGADAGVDVVETDKRIDLHIVINKA